MYCRPNMLLPVPGLPVISVEEPSGNPPCTSSSKPFMPVLQPTFEYSFSRYSMKMSILQNILPFLCNFAFAISHEINRMVMQPRIPEATLVYIASFQGSLRNLHNFGNSDRYASPRFREVIPFPELKRTLLAISKLARHVYKSVIKVP